MAVELAVGVVEWEEEGDKEAVFVRVGERVRKGDLDWEAVEVAQALELRIALGLEETVEVGVILGDTAPEREAEDVVEDVRVPAAPPSPPCGLRLPSIAPPPPEECVVEGEVEGQALREAEGVPPVGQDD